MSKRVCAKCGKEKEVRNAKICVKEHFICQSCAHGRSSCPICQKSMK